MSSQLSSTARRQDADFWRQVGRHIRQIGRRPAADWEQLAPLVGVTFRPGDHTSTFAGKLLRPAGLAVTVVMSYGRNDMPQSLCGYRSRVQPHGLVTQGWDGDQEFSYDARHSLLGNGPLSARDNPSLVDLLLRMDTECWRRCPSVGRLPQLPQMPRIRLAFASHALPEFVDTPALRRIAAQSANISLSKLEANPAELRERFLQDIWEAQFVAPGTADNTTEFTLLDADLYPSLQGVLRVYEDFRRLVGAYTWNPVRGLTLFQVANPAAEILQRHGFDPTEGSHHEIPHAAIEQMETDMGLALGELAPRFSSEDLLDGLAAPTEPLVAVTSELAKLRSKLSVYWSDCTSDDDLRNAARHPDEALFASGACRIQVLRRDIGSALYFDSEQLNRQLELDWEPVPYRSRVQVRFATGEANASIPGPGANDVQ